MTLHRPLAPLSYPLPMPGLILLFLTAYLLIVLICSAIIIWQIVRPRRKTFAVALAQGLPTDPAELELDAQDATFNLPGNHTTPGWIITGQQPDGPTVLILHGHRDAGYGSLRFAKQLAPYAGHIVVFDWPGHGGCSARWMTCGVREPQDALAVVDGLPDPLRDKPLVLFGYSLGGQIAIKTAATDPRFAGVIVDGAYRHWDTPVRLRLKKHRVPQTPIMQVVGCIFAATGLIKNFDRAHHARQIQAPLLVLHGTDDRVCPFEEGQQLAEAAPDSTFVPIHEGRHNRLHEHDPDTYHAALAAFFESIAVNARPAERQSPLSKAAG